MADKTLEEVLLEKHGALMSVDALAKLLDTTPRKITNGFANNLPWCRQFKPARIKVGRRVYLNTLMVASILLSAQDASAFGADVSRHAVAQVCGLLRHRLRGWVLLLRSILYYAGTTRIFEVEAIDYRGVTTSAEWRRMPLFGVGVADVDALQAL